MNIAKEKYNVIGIFVAIVFLFSSCGILYLFQDSINDGVLVILGSMCFMIFLLIHAGSQILSGYAWKNRAPWSNGISRSENPIKFWTGIGFQIAFGVAIFGLGLLSFFLDWHKVK